MNPSSHSGLRASIAGPPGTKKKRQNILVEIQTVNTLLLPILVSCAPVNEPRSVP